MLYGVPDSVEACSFESNEEYAPVLSDDSTGSPIPITSHVNADAHGSCGLYADQAGNPRRDEGC